MGGADGRRPDRGGAAKADGRAITALRMLPDLVGHALHGEAMPPAPKPMTLRAMAGLPLGEGGWVLLGERPGEEIALGQ